MSRDFIGSKIAIITKSQCRYVGTIIGIDAQTSSVLLGNVKCFGTENRPGSLTSTQINDTILPIMQFANNDIEDLKIVEEDQKSEIPLKQSNAMAAVIQSQKPSVHDDPAIVSAVVSSSYQDNTSVTSRLTHDLQSMSLFDSKPKNEESRTHSNTGDLGPSWPSFFPSKWDNNNDTNLKSSSQQRSDNKSKFFDDFLLDSNKNAKQSQSNRSHQHVSNNHSTQTFRENGNHYNGQQDDNVLPTRQPFFTNDNPYPQRQQQNRYHNDNMQHRQRYFYNNHRGPRSNQHRYGGNNGGGNREAFQVNPNDFDNDFDFETSNRKFNKITNEDELNHQGDLGKSQLMHLQINNSNNNSNEEFPILYDKKKSFFDNLVLTEQSDGSTLQGYNRSKNTDTFGNDGYQRHHNRSNNNNGYRKSNNNYRQHQHGNDDFHYKQHNYNKNGYNNRY